MDVSGTLHLYSGQDRELFFVFDDDVAQELYSIGEFDIADPDSRRAYISVGADRFIHRRTLSFSKKQTEIKVSLCSRGTKEGLGALTVLYDWFCAAGRPRPAPFGVLGTLLRVARNKEATWELRITEPAGLVAPPGLGRRRKAKSRERTSFDHRRQILQRDLTSVGRPAEQLALLLALREFPSPKYSCLWRKDFLDSERIEIRRMGVIADIDVWNSESSTAEVFVEVKAQNVLRRGADPRFYLSVAEWRSYGRAAKARIPYQVWLFQYRDLRHFRIAPGQIELIVFDQLRAEWLDPDGYVVIPGSSFGERFDITF